MEAKQTRRVRLAEVLGSLAVAIDLGLGTPSGTLLRTTLVGLRLGRAAGLNEAQLSAVYQLCFLRFVGCSTTSHQTSHVIEDELAIADLLVAADDEVMPLFTSALSAGRTPTHAQAAISRTMTAIGDGLFLQNHRMHCEAARLLASRLGLSPEVQQGLLHVYERWDGKSNQRLAEGEGISLPMRVAQVALLVGLEGPRRTPDELAARARRLAGNQFDPRLAALLAEDPAHFVSSFDTNDLERATLDAEPGEPLWLEGAAMENALTAIADFGDFKAPHLLGHSRRVAEVATAAARAASLPAADVRDIGLAALVHDIGKVGVQSQLLIKSGALSHGERERIRLHSYLTSRVFSNSPALAPLGALGSSHHERMDGSGYHLGLQGPALSASARILAAANSWCGLTEARPHRTQRTEREAADALAREATGLDKKAVEAVLTAMGQRGPRTRRAASLALSEREIEVLQLVAREHTNASIAAELGLSPKTVERHVTHIYDKLGVSTRAGATLYALENGLL